MNEYESKKEINPIQIEILKKLSFDTITLCFRLIKSHYRLKKEYKGQLTEITIRNLSRSKTDHQQYLINVEFSQDFLLLNKTFSKHNKFLIKGND
jgi:hypothetical protein